MESVLKDPLNKGHSTFDLSIKDKFCSVNGTKLQKILLQKSSMILTRATMNIPNIQEFVCKIEILNSQN